MPIVAAFQFHSTPVPARAYLHSAGQEVFGSNPEEEARRYIKEALRYRSHQGSLKGIAFALGILWGDTAITPNEKMLDLFGYALDPQQHWRTSNPTVHTWTIRSGVWQPSTEITCEDSIILLGKEAAFRRSTVSLEAYMRELPPFAREFKASTI